MKNRLLLFIVCCCLPRGAAAQTPWMFDFDINLTADQAYVSQHLSDLQSGLPGLPPDGIVELTSKQTKLYFYQDIIDLLIRARDSGPGTDLTVTRTPQRCVEHFGFVKPSMLLDSPPPLCDSHEQGALAAFEPAKLKTCGHVEFPETYVYDQPVVSPIFPTTTADLDVLIAILGDAVIQMNYPTGLVAPDFLTQARKIIAKLRYVKLKAEITARRQEYEDALGQLQANNSCFKPTELQSFVAKVGQLIAELDGVELDLSGIYNAGLAQAVADRKAVEAQGRIRANLAHPALTDRERELLAVYLGGLSWRVRGGGLIDGGRIPLGLAMAFVGPPYQLIADIAGGIEGKDVGLPLYINESSGYYLWWDMGTEPGGNDKYSDLVQMTNRGKSATTLTAPVLEGRGFDIRHLVAGGLMMGPCYYYIWEELPDFVLGPPCTPWPGLPVPPNSPGCLGGDYTQFLEWPTATGEFCTGAALALGLVKTLLWGKPGTACTPDCFNKPCGADNTCGGTCMVCPDSGVTIPADSSVPSPDGGSPASDSAAPPVQDVGVSPNQDAGISPRQDAGGVEQPAPSDGCSCNLTTDPGLTPLALFLGLLLVLRRRRR